MINKRGKINQLYCLQSGDLNPRRAGGGGVGGGGGGFGGGGGG